MKAIITTCAAVLAAAVLAAPAWAGTSYPPIAPGPATVLPDFVGSAVGARPLPSANVPQDPFLGRNPYGYIHDDSWNSDTSSAPGPLGRGLETISSRLGLPAVLQWASCTSTIAFDSHGRLVVNFMQDGIVPRLDILLVDPVSLDTLAAYPAGAASMGTSYFFVDDHDRVVISTGPRTITILREGGTAAAPTLEPQVQYDLSQVIPSDDALAGLLPDWSGRIWFETVGMGASSGPRVGVIDPEAWPHVEWVELNRGEQIGNGLAVNKNASFVLTSEALYKLVAGRDDRPAVAWRAGYDHSVDKSQTGQLCIGSGTSPTILGGGKYVTINVSGTPMQVLVFRTADSLKHGQDRLVGAVPVFADMSGQACAQSLLGYRDSIVVENNYGHTDGYDQNGFLTSTPNLPGLERIDIRPDGKGLRVVWVNDEVRFVSGPKLSTKTGLIYVSERRDDTNGVDAHYWTAVDFRTGKVVWRKLAGTGAAWDNYWSLPALGRTGTFYVAEYGGLAAIKDGADAGLTAAGAR